MFVWEIWGKYFDDGEWELIDVADDRRTRDYLLGEYRLSFGAGWHWKVEFGKGE